MKPSPRRHATLCNPRTVQTFALQPIALAVLMALAAPAWAGPNGGQVVAGQATISQTAPGQQLITQGTNKAVIDWQGFSIGANESVRIQQPTASSVLLNRVVGTDPSHILGQMQANGRVFLLNPYGVVFGTGARIDVGGLVASTLDLSNADFMAGTFRLTSAGGPAQRGIVRNDGTISAPGGTVALAGPNVVNTGAITADGGRIGLAAADSVLVDVEGDGLIFFQTDATQATNRLEQLGRLQADGGSVEVRAAARGAFADTVLNLGGVVQARGLGSRNGRIVIDGTADGIVQVSGQLDASSADAGESGGRITVQGERVRLTDSAALDTSGAAGGGTIHVGGGFQGQDAGVRNALVTAIASGASLRADAVQQGDGGEVVVWADDTTRFNGTISARGGAQGGNGGDVEVSGKQTLLFRGDVDTRAPLGERGTLLLDPDDLLISNDVGAIDDADVSIAAGGANVTVSANYLSGYTGATITLAAGGDITFKDAVANTTAGTSLTATAGDTLTVSSGASIQVDGDLTLSGSSVVLQGNLSSAAGQVQLTGPIALQGQDITIAGASVVIGDAISSAQRALSITATNGGITLGGNVALSQIGDTLALSATGGAISAKALTTDDGAITLNSASGLTLAGNVDSGSAASHFTGPVTLGADVQVTAGNITFDGSVSGSAHGLSLLGTGTQSLKAVNVASLSTGSAGSTVLQGNVTTSSDQRYGNAVIAAADVILDAGSGAVSFSATLNGTTADTESVTVTAGTTTFGGAVGGGTRLDALTVTNAAHVDGGRVDARTQSYGALEIGAATTLSGNSVTVAGATTQAAAHALTIDADASLGTVTVAELTVNGSATLEGNVTTAADQHYVGAVTAAADLTLAAGSGAVSFDSTLDGTTADTESVTVTAGTATFTGAVGSSTRLDALTVTNAAHVDGGRVDAVTQSYGSLEIGAATTLSGSSVTVAGATTQAAAHALTLDAATASLGAVTVNQLTANGSTTLNGNVTTGGAQQYANVVLGADTTLSGTSVGITGATTQSGTRTLTIAATTSSLGAVTVGKLTVNGTTTLNGDVSTSDTQQYANVVLGADRQLTAAGSSDVDVTGTLTGAHGLSVDAGGTTRLRGAVNIDSLTTGTGGGTEIGGNVTTSGGQVYGNAVTLAGDAVLTAGTDGVDFQSTVVGAYALSVNTSGQTRFQGVVGSGTGAALTSLATDAGGLTRLGADVTTSGAQTYGDALQLDASVTLAATGTASNVQFNGAVNAATAGTQSLTVNASGQAGFGAAVGATAALGGLGVSAATIAVGNATTTGAVTLAGSTTLGGSIATNGGSFSVTGPTTLSADTTVNSGSGAIAFGGTVNGSTDGGQSLSLASSGAAAFSAAVGATQRLRTLATDAGGSTTLRSVTTSGDQHYGDAATFAANANLAGADIRFDDTVGGGIALQLAPTGSATLSGNATLQSLTVNGATTLGADVTATLGQTYNGALTLSGPATTLTAATVTVAGALDASVAGASALTVATTGAATFQSAIGSTRALSGFTTAAGGSVSLQALRTSGHISLGNDATLGGDLFTNGGDFSAAGTITLAGATRRIEAGAGDVHFAGAVAASAHGSQSLVVESNGTTRFDAGVGTGTLALANLATDAAGSTQLGGSLYTTGNQTFADAVTLTAATAIDANDVAFGGGLALGTHDLVLQLGGNFSFGGTASGTGFVSLAPRDATQAIYIGSGGAVPGEATFDLNPLLSAGITRIGVGRADSSGTLRVGALALAADTKLQTGSGDIVFTDAITGSHELAVESATGTIEFQGVTIDTGSAAQSYQGALRLAGSNTLRGGSVSLGGTVDATVAGADGLRIEAAGGLALQGAVGAGVILSSFEVQAPITLQQDTSIAAVAVQLDSVDGAFALDITSTTVDFRGDIGGTTALSRLSSTSGEHRFNTGTALRIETTGDQHYSGPTRIDTASVTFVGDDIGFTGAVYGSGALTATAAGAAGFGSTVSLAALTVNGAGSTTLGGSVTTAGAQSYGNAVTLTGNVALDAGSAGIHFADTVDGAHALTVSTGGTTRFDGAIGGTTALSSLGTTGSATTVLGADVRTTNSQSHGHLTLGADLTLTATAGNIAFGGTVDGAHALAVDAAGTTSFAAAVGGTQALVSLDVAGGASLGNVSLTTTGAQRWRGALGLTGGATLASTASGSLRFDGAINGLGSLTANTAGTTEFNAAVGATQALAALGTDAAGSTTLAANVRTSGAQTYGDAVSLTADTTITAGSVDFASSIDGAHALTVNAAGVTRFGGAVGGSTALASLATNAGGGSTLEAGVRTSGAQSFGDRVTLGGDFVIEAGGALGFADGITAGSHALTLRAGGALTVGNTVTGSGAAVIEPVAVGTSIGVAGGLGSLQISQAALDRFAGIASLTLGRSDGSGAITVGNLVLPTTLTLRSQSGTVNFGGTVDSAAGFAHGLTVDTTALTTFAGSVGGTNAPGSMSIAHAAQIDAASVRTSGTQHYAGALGFGADSELHAPALQLDAGLATSTHDVALFTDSLGLAGSVSGTSSARLAAFNASGSIGLAGAAGTLQLSQSLLDQFAGLSLLRIGRADGTAAVTANALSLATDTTLHNGSGGVILGAVAGNGHALAVDAAGTTRFGGAVSGVSTLSTDAAGSATLGADITTSGNQHYGDALTLDASATLASTGGSVRFGGSVGGAYTLTTDAAVGTRFDGTVSLAALDVQQAATVNGGSVATTGSQHWGGAVTLGADTTFAGSTVTFDAGVSGSHALTVNASTTLHDDVSTTGAQTYGGTLTLAGDVRLTSAGSIGFAGTVGGAHALTLDAAGGTSFGGAVSIASLDVLRAASLGNAAITTSGAQRWRGALGLTGSATLASTGSGLLRFDSAIDGPGSLTANTAGTTQFDAALGTTQALASLTTDAAGSTTLAANVRTSGAQTYGDAVTLTADATLTAGSATFAATVDGAHALMVSSAGLTTFGAAVGGNTALASLSTDAPGSTRVGADITTSGLQRYGDAVTLTADADFTAGALVFDNTLAAGSYQLGLQADALALNGTVSGIGTVSLAPSLAATTIGLAGGVGTYQLTQATLSRFTGFSTLAIGRSDGSGDIRVGHLVLPMNTMLQSDSGSIHLDGSVNSAAGSHHDFTVRSASLMRVGGAIGDTTAVGALSFGGDVQLGHALVSATTAQHYGGSVTLGTDATLQAAAIDIAGPLSLGAHDLTVQADALTLGGAASGTGTARLATFGAGGSIGIAGGAGTLQLSQSLLDRFAGLSQLSIGRSDGSGAITAGAFTLPTALAIDSASGAVTLAGAVNSAGTARDLRIATGGLTTLAGAVGDASALRDVAITGAVALAADTTLTADSVDFAGTVDGAHALTVNAATTRFGGTVGGATALARVTTDAAGRTTLGAGVRTSGAQRYGDDVVLAASSTLQGSAIAFAGTVDGTADGAQSLVLDAADTTLGGTVGGTARLGSFTATGRALLSGGSVSSTGAQSWGGAVTLAADTTLASAGLSFAGTVDGAHALVLRSSGLTRFDAAVGAATALASLDTQLGGTVQLGGPSIETLGAQHYGGALQLSGDTRLTASSLDFDGAVSGATDLLLQTDTLSVGAGLAGNGVLTIAARDASRSVGVAGGSGDLQITQAVLDGASGFTQHVIGRSDGSGTLNVGALALRANTTLQTGSADLQLDGGVNGGFDLALASGGTTRIARDIGTLDALRSLTTDNQANAADWNGTSGEHTRIDSGNGSAVRIVTSGAQTFLDPLVTGSATAFTAFTGSTLSAMHAANAFGGAVSVTADSLQLRSASNLQLADVALAGGGSVEADGTIELAGALQLQGGTLSLRSNALPSAVGFTDPALQNPLLNLRGVALAEASAAIFQSGGALTSSAGSLLSLRAAGGGSILLEQAGNALQGDISAVSGTPGDTSTARFDNGNGVALGFVRITSSEIHVAGAPPVAGDAATDAAGIEADAVKLSTDWLTTGATGQIRARLPYENLQGFQTSVPGLTLVMGPKALAANGGFGGAAPESWVQVHLGGITGGYLSVSPKGAGGQPGSVLVGGRLDPRPFYDGEGKAGEVRMFYNGSAPRTPQEQGALTAVTATVEEARQARFDDAVRTENVSSRLRSGVIAEVGSGRPATVGSESIRMPEVCDPAPGQLFCE